MKSVDIRSERAVEYLKDFLDTDGEKRNILHFVHGMNFYSSTDLHSGTDHIIEVYTFVCSPFHDLFMYDAAVQYDGLPGNGARSKLSELLLFISLSPIGRTSRASDRTKLLHPYRRSVR